MPYVLFYSFLFVLFYEVRYVSKVLFFLPFIFVLGIVEGIVSELKGGFHSPVRLALHTTKPKRKATKKTSGTHRAKRKHA